MLSFDKKLESALFEESRSDDRKLLSSVMQKLDAMPAQMPYNTIWTDISVLEKRFGLTPEESQALRGNRSCCVRKKGGFLVDRDALKLNVSRPQVPLAKDRIRQERGTYKS